MWFLFYFILTAPTTKSEERDSSEEAENVVDNISIQYAQIPTSTPRKLKTLYEALASDQNTIWEDQDEELYGSPSPRSSLSGR